MKTSRWCFLAVPAVVAYAGTAQAQLDSRGVMDDALLRLRTAAQGWEAAIGGAASRLFWALALVSLVWTMGLLALRRAELGEVFGEFVRYLLFTGFWAWMLAHGPQHARLIMDSFAALGGAASARSVLSPSGIVDVGFHLLDRILTQTSILSSPVDSAIGIILAFIILVVLALVAINMLVLFASVWFVAYGGLFVLGFGGCRWTSEMAIHYYKAVLSLGLQVLAMTLIVGVGQGMIEHYASALGKTDLKIQDQAVLLVVAILILVLGNRVPPLLGSLANGVAAHTGVGAEVGLGHAASIASTAAASVALTYGAVKDLATSFGGQGAEADAASLWSNGEGPNQALARGHLGQVVPDAAPPAVNDSPVGPPNQRAVGVGAEGSERQKGKTRPVRGSHGATVVGSTGAAERAASVAAAATPVALSATSSNKQARPESRQGELVAEFVSGSGRAAGAQEQERHRERAASGGERPRADPPRVGTDDAARHVASDHGRDPSAGPLSGQTTAGAVETSTSSLRGAAHPLGASPLIGTSSPASIPTAPSQHGRPATQVDAAITAISARPSLAQPSFPLPATVPPPAGALAVPPSVWSLGGPHAPNVAGLQDAVRGTSTQTESLHPPSSFNRPADASRSIDIAPDPHLSTGQLASTLALTHDRTDIDFEAEVAAFRDRG